jgi:hypothetical protein
MAEQQTEETGFKVDDIVIFTGFRSKFPPGQKPNLKDGERVRLVAEGKDGAGSFVAAAVDDEERQDSVFDNEVERIKEEAKPQIPMRRRSEEAPPPPPARTRGAAAAPAPKRVKGQTNGKNEKGGTKAAAKKGAATTTKTPKTRKTKTLAAPKPPVEDEKLKDTAAVEAVLKKQDVLAAAKSMNSRINEDYFTFAGVLAHIQIERSYEAILGKDKKPIYVGVDGFRKYCEDELDTKPRKALYLIDIYRHFTQLGSDEKRLTEIGWSKASQISRVADGDNFEKLLDYAKKHSKDELQEHIDEKYVSGSGKKKRAKLTRFAFAVFNDQAKMVKQALSLAGEKMEGEQAKNPSAQLAFMATDWLAVQENADIPLKNMIAFIEQKYKVTLQEAEKVEA